ncbi:hypothetical protein M9978_19940 [Sphingomonas sp. MG17]|uniref:Uncharacterized protein n=1 Tax=Sphingomonas tagetis TaxID=2949092 RepID=A0A9X2HSC4_9SPHN|nr:hypothetical protein [Sphingomonas tagetis]MCP3732694.1 hypothetical protein [Sphingomonas tagetis]
MIEELQRQQEAVAQYMGAFAQLLSGQPGRHDEFIDKVDLLIAGSEPNALRLMQFTNRVRTTQRPVIWIHFMHEEPNVPQIGLVAAAGGQVHIMENCMLWLSKRDSRARLVPDSFKLGAYQFDDELRLRRLQKAPARNFKAARPAMIRAYDRLLEIQAEQRQRGDEFRLPELARAA